MRILLDTHMVLWWYAGDEQMSEAARALVGDHATTSFVSTVSVWEIAIKARAGKLRDAVALTRDLPVRLHSQGFPLLDITAAHAHRAGWLPGEHRDPFDRILAAQALTENLPILSVDACFDDWGLRRLS